MMLVLLKVSIAGLIFAIGTNTTAQDVTYFWQRPMLLVKSLVAMYMVMPVAAVMMAWILDPPPQTELALVVLAICAGAPLLPKTDPVRGRPGLCFQPDRDHIPAGICHSYPDRHCNGAPARWTECRRPLRTGHRLRVPAHWIGVSHCRQFTWTGCAYPRGGIPFIFSGGLGYLCKKGAPAAYSTEPESTFRQRFMSGFIKLLPVEGQL
jgi:hypothetical protein